MTTMTTMMIIRILCLSYSFITIYTLEDLKRRFFNIFIHILVDEFRSSCKCSKCDGGICEKFMVREHPKKNKDELRLIHGLLHCKNGCGSWNRDRNGSSNIYKIAKNAINNIDRPSYLCRETSNQSTSTSAYNQTILRV